MAYLLYRSVTGLILFRSSWRETPQCSIESPSVLDHSPSPRFCIDVAVVAGTTLMFLWRKMEEWDRSISETLQAKAIRRWVTWCKSHVWSAKIPSDAQERCQKKVTMIVVFTWTILILPEQELVFDRKSPWLWTLQESVNSVTHIDSAVIGHWPQQWLPLDPDICSSRILTFGYNARFRSGGPQNMDNRLC